MTSASGMKTFVYEAYNIRMNITIAMLQYLINIMKLTYRSYKIDFPYNLTKKYYEREMLNFFVFQPYYFFWKYMKLSRTF